MTSVSNGNIFSTAVQSVRWRATFRLLLDALIVAAALLVFWPMNKPDDKPKYVIVTDPETIAAIQRNLAEYDDPIGQQINGTWYADKASVERWKKRQEPKA